MEASVGCSRWVDWMSRGMEHPGAEWCELSLRFFRVSKFSSNGSFILFALPVSLSLTGEMDTDSFLTRSDSCHGTIGGGSKSGESTALAVSRRSCSSSLLSAF